MLTDRFASVTLQQLRVFAAVAREGGFARAAKALFLSEPAVSDHIKVLEAHVGVRLIDRARGRRHVELTPAGVVLLGMCDSILGALERGARALETVEEPASEAVALGAGPSFGGYFLPELYASFRQRHPNVALHLDLGRRPDVVEAVKRGQLDLGIVVGPVEDASLVAMPLLTFSVVLVGPPGHRLASLPPAPFQSLTSERLIVASRPSAIGKALSAMAHEHRVSLLMDFELVDTDTRMQAVANGLGIAAMNLQTVHARIQSRQLALLNVEGFPLQMQWYVVHRPGPLRPVIDELKCHMLEQWAA